VAATLAGPSDDPDLLPRGIANMEGPERFAVIEAVLEANPKAYLKPIIRQMVKSCLGPFARCKVTLWLIQSLHDCLQGIEDRSHENLPGAALLELGRLLGLKQPVDRAKISLCVARAAKDAGDLSTAITMLASLMDDSSKQRSGNVS